MPSPIFVSFSSLWRFWLLLVTTSLLQLSSVVVLACDFCPNNAWDFATYGPHPDREDWLIQSGGVTCGKAYMDAVTKKTGCNQLISNYRNVCCYNDRPGTQAPQPSPTSPPGGVQKEGTEPVCYLCGDERFPGKPYNVIFSNYIEGGSASCKTLYIQGKQKNILEMVCYPLQLYAQTHCGCNLSPPATPAPTPKQTAPPTAAPTFPQMRERPRGRNKNALKEAFLVGNYRSCRGCVNNGRRERTRKRGLLRGERASSSSSRSQTS